MYGSVPPNFSPPRLGYSEEWALYLAQSEKRRSTIQVLPIFSKAPHLRSSIPQPETDFSKNQNCIAASDPMARVYKNILFRNQDWHSDDLGIKEPRLSETK